MSCCSRVLITGLSAVGRSSTIEQLAACGHRAIDLDGGEWSHLVPDDSAYADSAADRPCDWRWRKDRVHALLAAIKNDGAMTACARRWEPKYTGSPSPASNRLPIW